ncbi:MULTISPECIES: hypothetical protein [Burkholderia]|uniref:hypothetical protein n=1 Tax=Burkholderia TaxID=32008 RepID=UPI001D0F9353|nr:MULTISPECIES: hypothetical protein [Burkholderia]
MRDFVHHDSKRKPAARDHNRRTRVHERSGITIATSNAAAIISQSHASVAVPIWTRSTGQRGDFSARIGRQGASGRAYTVRFRWSSASRISPPSCTLA